MDVLLVKFLIKNNQTTKQKKKPSKYKDQKGKQKQISKKKKKKNTLGFTQVQMTSPSCGVWSWYKHQTSAKGSDRDQAEELGLPSGSEAPEMGKNAGNDEALLRPTQMTTPLHAGKKALLKCLPHRRQQEYVLRLIILI